MALFNQTPGKMNRAFKIMWGVGNLGAGLLGGIVAGYQLYYYQNVLGMSASLYGLAITLFTIWNAFNDPIMGIISDKTKTRWGRRVPYFRASIPVVAFSFVMLWFVPFEANPMFQFFWLFVSLFLYDLSFTMFYMMYVALMPEITEHEDERADLVFSYTMFSFVGSLIGLILPGLINPNFKTAAGISDFKFKMLAIGIMCTIFMAVTAFNVKERLELRRDLEKSEDNILKQILSIFNKHLIITVFVSFLHRGAGAVIVALMYYISTFVLKMDSTTFIIIVMLPQGFAYPILLKIQKRIGAIQLLETSFLISGVALIIGALMPMKEIALFFYAISGIGQAGVTLAIKMPFYDCIDYDELRAGERREGLMSVAEFIKVFSFLFTITIPFILDKGGFVKASQNGGVDLINQPASAIEAIQFLVVATGILYLLAFIIFKMFYKLRGKELQRVRDEVFAMHKEKADKYGVDIA